MLKKSIILLTLIISSITAYNQPAGYYSGADGKSGSELQLVLHDIIDNHTVISYSGLWNAFKTTDKKTDGSVWDIYSDIPGGTPPYTYTFVTDQCGNYSGESSCYNREHSFPKSWFNDASPMYSDLYHLYPTDGYVNGKRRNYPYGETNSPDWTSLNGSKLGPCSVTGYTGTVFEPLDEYKGDLARTYFYMAVRYYGEDSAWPGSPMVDGSQPEPWAREMLMKWHEEDPVSEKEIERNEAVYQLQGNRNPFIDHPEYAARVFKNQNFDELAPVVDSITVTDSDHIRIWFNEVLDPESALETSHYSVSNDIAVVSVTSISTDSTTVELNVDGLQNGSHILTINGVSDTSGNVMTLAIYPFTVNSLSIDVLSGLEIRITPNPGKDHFFIKIPGFSAGKDLLSVFDISGREIPCRYSDSGSGILLEINARPGCYALKYMNCDGFSSSTMFMIH